MLCCSTGALMQHSNTCIATALSEECNWFSDAQLILDICSDEAQWCSKYSRDGQCLKRTPALSLWVSLLEQESWTRWSPASAILWSCDSPSIYRSSVTEQQLRIGLIMKSLLCLTVKVGLNCKSLLSSNLLWVVLISEGSALRIWYCCTYSILSFLMQIKYYNPVLTYCQCCAWYYKLSHLAV